MNHTAKLAACMVTAITLMTVIIAAAYNFYIPSRSGINRESLTGAKKEDNRQPMEDGVYGELYIDGDFYDTTLYFTGDETFYSFMPDTAYTKAAGELQRALEKAGLKDIREIVVIDGSCQTEGNTCYFQCFIAGTAIEINGSYNIQNDFFVFEVGR